MLLYSNVSLVIRHHNNGNYHVEGGWFMSEIGGSLREEES